MKRIISVPALCIAITISTCSCSDTSYSKTGIKFLDAAFGYSELTAIDMLSDDFFMSRDNKRLSDYEIRKMFAEGIKEVREDCPGNIGDFKFHYGYTYHYWIDDCAVGYYSYGSQKEYIIVLDFVKEDECWKIDDMDVCQPKELISSYKNDIESLEYYLMEDDKDMVKSKKVQIRHLEKAIRSFRGFFSDSELDEMKSIK